jgi:hypothetical protein
MGTKIPVGLTGDDGDVRFPLLNAEGNSLFTVSSGGVNISAEAGVITLKTSVGASSLLGISNGGPVLGTYASATSVSTVMGSFNVYVCLTDSAGRVFYVPAKTSAF